MPADNHVTATGWIVSDPKLADGNRPSSIRISSYCSGSKQKDNVRKVFLTVKSFDRDTVALFAKGMKVHVEGRFDTWDDKEGHQVIEVVADDGGITEVATGDGDDDYVARRPAAAQLPPLAEEEVF